MTGALFDNNVRWAASRIRADPEYFRNLAIPRTPEHLWIGCSDSRVAAHEIVGLEPDSLFVHRNIANLAPPHDAGFLSALQLAVEAHKVRHVIVCGHYGCDGVRAALSGERHGLADHWLQPVRELCWRHSDELNAIADFEARVNNLCERNVVAQVASIAGNPVVRDAWRRGQPLAIHGWIYSGQDGLLRDMETTVAGALDAVPLLHGAGAARRPAPVRRKRVAAVR